MVEIEMNLQKDLIKINNPKTVSEYSKIEATEESNINTSNKDINYCTQVPDENNVIIINGKSYTVNSDQNRPITHKYFYSKLGNSLSFFGDEKGNPLIILGPHWPCPLAVCIIFSSFFFWVSIFFRKLISYNSYLIGFILYFIFLISYILTATLNPGYPKHDEETLFNKNKNKTGYCTVCKIWISLEKKTQHCNFCNICIEGRDHHCPWTGKCIGRRNYIPFFIFVGSVMGFLTYCIYTVIQCRNELNKISRTNK